MAIDKTLRFSSMKLNSHCTHPFLFLSSILMILKELLIIILQMFYGISSFG